MEELVLLLIGLLIIVGIIVLQISLSKQVNKWPGLILPIISLFFSMIISFNLLNPSIIEVIITFLVSNILTTILIVIYFTHRGKIIKKKQIDKMNILDLE
ncbi:hypothetical protein [Ornithinibacillus sp. FSL M8-0202]|uniref:hypothetical protein n=1 Tax=Ornithinibacillus sp. FSL M8-0202 TaxID=2921616 RepID=UPI0030CC5953